MVSESGCEVWRVGQGPRRSRPRGDSGECDAGRAMSREGGRGFRRLGENSANKSVGSGIPNAGRKQP